MTITRIYRIYCDHHGIDEDCHTPPIEHQCTEREVGGPGDARKLANQAGWLRLNGKDWCPVHKGEADHQGAADIVVTIQADTGPAAQELRGLQAEARTAVARIGRKRMATACDQP